MSVRNGIGKEDFMCLSYGQWGSAVLIDYVTGLAFAKDGCQNEVQGEAEGGRAGGRSDVGGPRDTGP